MPTGKHISGRNKTETRLRKSEEMFSKAFRANPVATTITDLTSRKYLDVNKAFEQLTGYERSEVIGKGWEEVQLWTDPSSRDEAVRHLVEHECVRNWEFGFRKKNGEVGTGLISAFLTIINGNPCAITATVDITERLRLQSQLLQAQKLESVGRLAGGVAHDFNNLLTVIMGYNDLLLKALGQNDRFRLCVEEIGRAAASAQELTQQLLTFSRKQVIAPKPLSLNKIVRDAERMLQRMIGEDIELISRLDPHLGDVMADDNQIHQVIMNLSVNARDAMPHGGKLIIETTNVDVGEKFISANADIALGKYVLMTVSDSGIGMASEVLHKIFEPFFTTKAPGKGTGLGLSTVYGIVKQSGGWVDVLSNVGKGTTFKIYLPRIETSPAEKQAPESS